MCTPRSRAPRQHWPSCAVCWQDKCMGEDTSACDSRTGHDASVAYADMQLVRGMGDSLDARPEASHLPPPTVTCNSACLSCGNSGPPLSPRAHLCMIPRACRYARTLSTGLTMLAATCCSLYLSALARLSCSRSPWLAYSSTRCSVSSSSHIPQHLTIPGWCRLCPKASARRTPRSARGFSLAAQQAAMGLVLVAELECPRVWTGSGLGWGLRGSGAADMRRHRSRSKPGSCQLAAHHGYAL
jgi:hypothetical protein